VPEIPLASPICKAAPPPKRKLPLPLMLLFPQIKVPFTIVLASLTILEFNVTVAPLMISTTLLF